MAKDPAVLIYFDKWIASTNGLKAEFRAWYFDLLIYNYDKGSIPNDFDELAGICRVRPSEYNSFNQMVEQVLKQKFRQNDNGTWYNELTGEILRKREAFVEKRAKSGNIGVVMKAAKSIKGFTTKHLATLKQHLFTLSPEEIDKHKNKQVLEHLLKLYIDVDVDVNKKVNKVKGVVYPFDSENFLQMWANWKEYKATEWKFYYKSAQSEQSTLTELANMAGGIEQKAIDLIKHAMAKNWKGFYPIQQTNSSNGNGTGKTATGGNVDTSAAFKYIDQVYGPNEGPVG